MTRNGQNQTNAKPSIFYKYYPVEPWLPKLLDGSSLLFSSRTTFNDPFDCRPAFRIDSSKRAHRFYDSKLRSSELSPAKRLLLTNNIMARVRRDSGLAATQTNAMLDTVGVLCLSTSWENALMWSHYAKFHTGIAVGFHAKRDIFTSAQPVFYTDQLPVVVAPAEGGPKLFKDTFLTKAECWDYEDEWRIIKPPLDEEARNKQFVGLLGYLNTDVARKIADQRGAGIYQFSKDAIESLTLGMRISEEDEKMVRAALKNAGIDVPIYKVLPPSSTYSLARRLSP